MKLFKLFVFVCLIFSANVFANKVKYSVTSLWDHGIVNVELQFINVRAKTGNEGMIDNEKKEQNGMTAGSNISSFGSIEYTAIHKGKSPALQITYSIVPNQANSQTRLEIQTIELTGNDKIYFTVNENGKAELSVFDEFNDFEEIDCKEKFNKGLSLIDQLLKIIKK